MRKLILISALLAASATFAQAGESRSLSMTGMAVTEPAKPIAQVSMQLAQAATAPAEAAPAPAATTTTTTEPKAETKTTETTSTEPKTTETTTAETKTTETKSTDTKPSKPVKKVARESDEHKARRIAAKYGVYW